MRPLHRLAPCVLLAFASCSWGLFSGVETVDRTRPVALIETTGGVELGATTEFGILTLGRTATRGPCRVYYFLGPTPLVEDGTVVATEGPFCTAQIDLRTQSVRVLDHSPTNEPLKAMWTSDGAQVTTIDVQLARDEGVSGDVLADPGQDIPAGAGVFAEVDEKLRFVGLVSGRATVQGDNGVRAYYTFAGVDRVRELLAVPSRWPVDYEPRFRPDGINVLKPITEKR